MQLSLFEIADILFCLFALLDKLSSAFHLHSNRYIGFSILFTIVVKLNNFDNPKIDKKIEYNFY